MGKSVYQSPAWQNPAPPWQGGCAGSSALPSATLTNAGDTAQIQELIGALKGAYSNTSMPPEIAEMLARAEGGASKQQTKDLHSCTTQLGAARKQLHAARAAIQTQEAAWAAFLQQTADAVEKGAADHSSRMEEYKAKEEEALQRITAARKQIRALAAAKNEAEEVDASEPELHGDGGMHNRIYSRIYSSFCAKCARQVAQHTGFSSCQSPARGGCDAARAQDRSEGADKADKAMPPA